MLREPDARHSGLLRLSLAHADGTHVIHHGAMTLDGGAQSSYRVSFFTNNSLFLKAADMVAVHDAPRCSEKPVAPPFLKRINFKQGRRDRIEQRHTGKATPVARRGRKTTGLGLFKKAGSLPNNQVVTWLFYLSAPNSFDGNERCGSSPSSRRDLFASG